MAIFIANADGEIKGQSVVDHNLIELNVRDLKKAFPPDFFIIYDPDLEICDTEFDQYQLDLNTHTVKKRTVLLKKRVTSSGISSFRDKLVNHSITVSGMEFDSNDRSLLKMSAIADIATDNSSINWTMADNSIITVSGSEFKQLYVNVKKAHAARLYTLHHYSQDLKKRLPDVYEDDLKIELWPMDTTLPGGVFCLDLPMR